MMIAARNAFLMGGGTPTARDYVQDGLVAMWDGIENAGWGVHNDSATTWKNLVGALDLTVCNGASWITNGLHTTSRQTAGVAYSAQYISSAIGTIEVCMDLSADIDNGQGRGIVCNSNSRSIMSRGLVSLRTRGEESVKMLDAQNLLQSPWSASIVYASSAQNDAIFYNGTIRATESSSGNWNISNQFRIGRNTVNNTTTAIIGTCHCVRVYSRALTAAEVAANYAIDAARFGL